jgi:hypothetical protein
VIFVNGCLPRVKGFPLQAKLVLFRKQPLNDFQSSIPLKKPFQYLLILLGCLHLAGGPYSIMQCYAWIGMLVSYSQQDGLMQAAKDTFSGEKPCDLCCKIAEGKKSEPEKKEPVTPLPGFSSGKIVQEMLPSKDMALAPPSGTDLPPVSFVAVALPGDSLRASPLVPPPCPAV